MVFQLLLSCQHNAQGMLQRKKIQDKERERDGCCQDDVVGCVGGCVVLEALPNGVAMT
jgi:hypothetical protein